MLSRFAYVLCCLCTLLILTVLALVVGFLAYRGAAAIGLTGDFSRFVAFFTKTSIPQGVAGYPGGMLQAIVGTVILLALASLIGIPVGMLAGVYLSEYSVDSRLATPIRFIADVLSGVPSIVVGILGYELLVVPMGGASGYAGAAALAFIMIPMVARTTEEMLRLVPDSYRQASIALGASKARTIAQVVLPVATGSVVTGVMLALARVAGETAPLLFTALGASAMTLNPHQPFPSLTVAIYNYASGYPEQRDLAWGGTLVLIAMIFCVNLAIRYVTRGKK